MECLNIIVRLKILGINVSLHFQYQTLLAMCDLALWSFNYARNQEYLNLLHV